MVVLLGMTCCTSDRRSVEASGRATQAVEVEAIPLDASVLAVVATERVAWVVTGEDESRSLLWQVKTDGTSQQVGEVLGTSVQLSTNEAQVFVSSVRCADGATACESPDLGTVDIYGADGEQEGSVEFARSDTAGVSVSYEVAGIIDGALWLGALDRAVEIVAAEVMTGDVVPDVPGSPCAIDGKLYVLDSPQADGAGEQSAAQPPVVSGLPASSTHQVLTAEGDRWVDLADGTIEVPGGAFDVLCTPAGYEVVDYGRLETPTSVWTPDGGQAPVPSTGLPDASVTSPYRSPHGQVYLVRDDGVVMRRDPGSAAYTATGYAVDPAGPTGAAVPLIDESASLGVMCPAEAEEPDRCQVSVR